MSGVTGPASSQQIYKAEVAESKLLAAAQQEKSAKSLQADLASEGADIKQAFGIKNEAQLSKIKTAAQVKAEQVKKPEESESAFVAIEELDQAAKEFSEGSQGHSKEFSEKELTDLAKDMSKLNTDKLKFKTPTEKGKTILEEVSKRFGNDPAATDRAIQFLMNTTTDPELFRGLQEAQKNNYEGNKENIDLDHGLAKVSAQTAKTVGGDVKASGVRSACLEIMTSQKPVHELFDELHAKYGTLKEFKSMVSSLLKELGNAIKGHDAERGKLGDIFNSVRTLQAISHVHTYFEKRMTLLNKMVDKAP